MTSDLAWRKSSRSGGQGGECVEVATRPGAIVIRDSKDPHGSILIVSKDEWASFITRLRATA